MRKTIARGFLAATLLTGCASDPDKLTTAYVSPLTYRDYDCEQIGMEMEHVSARTGALYAQLRGERIGDNWQMGIGLVLFWPALFFLEGGDGPEAAEYSRLKGEFEALRQAAVGKKCSVTARSPEDIMREAAEREKREAEEAKSKQPLRAN